MPTTTFSKHELCVLIYSEYNSQLNKQIKDNLTKQYMSKTIGFIENRLSEVMQAKIELHRVGCRYQIIYK